MASPSSRSHWPPGFRFRPTDQELVGFYLSRKVGGRPFQAGVIEEVDLYKCEPWDLPDKSSFENDVEWYFFSPRDRKYPNGSRTNRATEAGYWKATGKDRVVRSGSKGIGMKKTLVFYKGRAPHGQRTEWIMHEYRLEGEVKQQSQDAFVLCRVFKKTTASKNEEEALPSYLDDDLVCSSSFGPAEVVAPVEPEEGQVCSPSAAENTIESGAAKEAEENADDSLDAFLTMLLEEPTAEESQMLALVNQHSSLPVEGGGGGDFGGYTLDEDANTLDELLQQSQALDKQIVGDEFSVNDMLAGDFIELNDLASSVVDEAGLGGQGYEPQQAFGSAIDVSDYLEPIQASGGQFATKVNASSWTENEGPWAEEGPSALLDMVMSDGEKRYPVKRFLGMLGSVQVLPANAAEYPPSSSSSSSKKLVVSDKKTSTPIHMNVAVTFTCTCPKKDVKMETGRRLLFVFLVGSISALFWVLLPGFSSFADYVHAALL